MLLRNSDAIYAANQMTTEGMCNGLIRHLSIVTAAKVIEPFSLLGVEYVGRAYEPSEC